ncbi:Lipopolysaccharide core heptose(I) kinase RfaP [Symmachiella dynata]|uniref:non-specific serine/threonine protein kinase n=1 Tax=Symmachiella dynata TaxID=2527995 RepID=A0A517ZVG4_9PLAN|nr:lipopolysaccharide kinase InaA family protein [Symmachiella dynata]QDU46459.1 Lipopolysaccharide core heptose(I) kinase RfaP [Symmachiella dynata]
MSAAPRETTFATVRCGDTHWQIRSDLQQELLDAHGLRRREWEQQQRVEVIKTGAHREVIRLDTAAGRFYIKHYKVAGIKPFLQNVIRPAKAVLEQRMAARVRALGIPTFETVAWAETRSGGFVWDNYLVTREIPGTQPLDGFLRTQFAAMPTADASLFRRRLAVELGRFTGKLHDAGIVHRDFHAGNILIRDQPAAPVQLWLIDLHCAHIQKSLGLEAAQQNLAMLHQFFATRSTRADRYRFFRAYCAQRGLSGSVNSMARDVQACCSRRAQRHWRRKDRKWRQGTRHLVKLRVGSQRGRGLTVLGRDVVRDICAQPEHIFAAATAWYKQSTKRRVAAVAVPTIPQYPRLFWKSLKLRGILPLLSQWLGRSSVRRAWENGHALLRRDIATPKPLLFVESAQGFDVRQYLLTESIPDSATLFDWHHDHLVRLPQRQRREIVRRLTVALAGQLRWLHTCGFEHRDLKSKNILVSQNDNDDRTWLLDLEAIRRWPRVPRDRMLQNLTRLNVSSTFLSEIQLSDRLRFLRNYLGSRYFLEWKSTWQKIEARTGRKIDKNRTNGRPLS